MKLRTTMEVLTAVVRVVACALILTILRFFCAKFENLKYLATAQGRDKMINKQHTKQTFADPRPPLQVPLCLQPHHCKGKIE